MDTEELTEIMVPPYVPYRTLLNLREGLRQGVPQRIDRSVMRSMGGTIQRQLIHALRYLQLTDEHGIPQEGFMKWVRAEGEERQKILRDILREAYDFLIGENTSGFDLATATPKQLMEKFQAFGIHGDTVRKAEAFFLNAASDANIAVSAYIKPSRQRRESSRSSRPRNGRRMKRRTSSDESQSLLPIDTMDASIPRMPAPPTPQTSLHATLIQALVTKLPDFDPKWEAGVQQKWFEAWGLLAHHLDHKDEDSTKDPI